MNSINNKLDKLINFNKKKTKNKRYARRRNNNRFRVSSYNVSTKPQCLGMGRTSVSVNYEDIVGSTDRNYTIQDVCGSNTEFILAAKQYRYFRIAWVNVQVYAATFSSDVYGRPTYIRIRWTDDTLTNIQTDDSTKVVPPNNIRTRIFKFLPPNASLPIGNANTSIKQINYQEWTICDDVLDSTTDIYNLPGTVQIVPTDENLPVNIIVRVHFRGRKHMTSEGAYLLGSALKKVEIKNKERKEECKKIMEQKALQRQLDKLSLKTKAQKILEEEEFSLSGVGSSS